MAYHFIGVDHVQLAAPEGCEPDARRFFADLLGWKEIPKPENLKKRGGVWFQCGTHQVHIGVQKDFVPAAKAHPAFHVSICMIRSVTALNFMNGSKSNSQMLEGDWRWTVKKGFPTASRRM